MATTNTEFDRFQSLWQRNLIEDAVDDSADIYRQLLQYYGEPQRYYHSLDHIGYCLEQFDQCKSLAHDANALELAIWFHDIILVSGRRDNEARSAEFYLKLSSEVQPDARRQLVKRLIMATLHDGSSLEDADSSLMVDIDLSSFGLPWEEFLRDSRNLRAECPQLSDSEYQLNQTGFQRSLLARPRFYLSDYFHDRLEQQARSNLQRYFEYLKNLA